MTHALTLCYHAVSRDWPAALSSSPEALEGQLELLVERGYQGVTFSEAVRDGCPPKAVAVTFDDAFASVLDVAFPILSRLGLPGTVFVPTDYPGSGRPMAWPGLGEWVGGPYENELRCMSWDQLRELRDAGWEIGSHTCSHPRLTQLDDDGLSRELAVSREVCTAELGSHCPALAYPYGDWDERVARAAAEAGYTAAATLPAHLHRSAPLRWPRVGVYRKDDLKRFSLKVSPVMRRARALSPWRAAALVGRAPPR